jgi:hypothetical protein
MRERLILLAALLLPALPPPALGGAPANALSPAQKKRADMLISVFENSTLEPQYGYVEDLGDGRGYTAGRAGFCSGTGDLLEVAKKYSLLRPVNPLALYLPRLEELAAAGGDPDGLKAMADRASAAAKPPAAGGGRSRLAGGLPAGAKSHAAARRGPGHGRGLG